MYFPSGQKEGSSIRVDKDVPTAIWVGQPFTETIKVTNISPKEIDHVIIDERMAAHFKPSGENNAEIRDGHATWNLGTLKPGESKTVSLSGIPQAPGDFRSCLRVDFQPELCTSRTAAVAKLDLSFRGPKESLLCDPLPYTVTVKNSGTARMDGIKVEGKLPDGITTEDGGKADLSIDAGSLGPGESKDVSIPLKATKKGDYKTTLKVVGNGANADASVETVVQEPELHLAAQSTPSAFAGSPARAEFTVTNTGDGASPDTKLEATVPDGIKVTGAQDQGAVTEKTVTWNLGTLKPRESRKVGMDYTGTAPGAPELVAHASGHCAKAVDTRVRTEFTGVPAVLLEVVDNPDPVAVGGTVTYTITVTNQGNTPLTHVRVKCDLEPSMEYQRSTGPTKGRSDQKTVEFEPLGELAPKAKAVWQVAVKARQPADARFNTSVTSDQVPRPAEKSESTHFVVQTP